MDKKTIAKKKAARQRQPEPEPVLTEKEQLIKDYVEHLMEKCNHDYISWTELNDIIDILKDKFYPHDCEIDTDDDEKKCLSKIGHLCKRNVNGKCTSN